MAVSARPSLAFALILAAASCADPGPRCTASERRELATIDGLIAETRDGLQRGYRDVAATGGASMNFCLGGAGSNVGMSFCTAPGPRTRPVPIDRASEERKLAALQARRDALAAQVEAKAATCPAI
ncbi:hypothetical protein OEZ60_19710 [Defluviimonas sp. WL0024]|uniref:Uncharacterized protein n=2 Tax=Albidovulum TaxID=205889 RepID=A0ABT3J6S4_9RHOB|nr:MULTISPECIES: hypothetical protein [Defluviimonas]MCU9850220.1 hypothetical protein [Defluviimonas sp. WL0024]MCW3783392.1 hypothetical protein [Defluviimonas salinarum]